MPVREETGGTPDPYPRAGAVLLLARHARPSAFGAPEDCMDRSAIAVPVADLHDDSAME